MLQSIDTCLLGVKNCPIIIVADGFKLDKENRTKKGAEVSNLLDLKSAKKLLLFYRTHYRRVYASVRGVFREYREDIC